MQEHAVTPKKLKQLQEKMKTLGIREEDLTERFILGSGHGGQKVNKTASSVYLKHVPSGLEVKCQESRSRELNRFLARRQLCEKYAVEVLGQQGERDLEIDKIRRQKKRRTRKQRTRLCSSDNE